MPTKITLSLLAKNATRTGHPTHTLAAAAVLCGLNVRSVCCWCMEKGANPVDFVRLPKGGLCDSCGYEGRDCLAAEYLD